MVAWGETWVSAKILNGYLNINELIFWRFLFASIRMLGVLLFLRISFKESLKELLLAFFLPLFWRFIIIFSF